MCDCGLCWDCGARPVARYGVVTIFELPKPGPGPHGGALYAECWECESPVLLDGRDYNASPLIAFTYWGRAALHGTRDCPALRSAS